MCRYMVYTLWFVKEKLDPKERTEGPRVIEVLCFMYGERISCRNFVTALCIADYFVAFI